MRRALEYATLLALRLPLFTAALSSSIQRFAPEMLELVAAAEPGEWPLILGDTSVAIIRCWLTPAATSSAALPSGQNAYLALGESALEASRLLQGLVLSIAIIIGLCYLGSIGYLQLPNRVAAENVWQ